MKGVRNIVIAGCSVFLLSNCASQDEVRKLGYQIRAVNQKVEEVKSSTVDQMQKRQASSVNRLDEVAGETGQLRALIEESEQRSGTMHTQTRESLAGLQASVDQMRADNEQRINALEMRVDQLTATMERLQQARVEAAEQRAREAAKRAEEARKRTVVAAAGSDDMVTIFPNARKVRVDSSSAVAGTSGAAAPSVDAVPAPAANKPSAEKTVVAAAPAVPVVETDLFSQGMAGFKAGRYKEAYASFEQVLAGNPQGEKAAQTLFYMGECLFNQEEYDLAILDYQKVISNHAKDPHTPASLLKQGISFEKLTDHETAKIIYKKLIADYKDSSEAGLAADRLEKL